MKPQKILMLIAGLSLALIARHLALQGHELNAVDTRDHMACSCHTERDTDAGLIVHIYDTHILRTNDDASWDYVNTHMSCIHCKNQVKTTAFGHVSSLRFKLHTVNQFVGKSKLPDEAQEFIETRADTSISEPHNFEEQALRFVGRGLYESFFSSYTLKQWSCAPTNLPASILKRLHVPFSYGANYFEDKFQDMPAHGYTKMVESTLGHANIIVHLNTRFNRAQEANYHYVFCSGPLFRYSDYDLGDSGFRTLDFKPLRYEGYHRSYDEESATVTRIIEHKHFSPRKAHEGSILHKEFSRAYEKDNIPYYPIRLVEEPELLRQNGAQANVETGVTFVGRLGIYRYLYMDGTTREILDTVRALEMGTLPSFVKTTI